MCFMCQILVLTILNVYKRYKVTYYILMRTLLYKTRDIDKYLYTIGCTITTIIVLIKLIRTLRL